MSIAIIYPGHDRSAWVQALQSRQPDLEVEVWPQITAPERVELALCWNQPSGCLRQFPNLKLISSFGAGVDHLLNDPQLPDDIPIVRLVDPQLQQSMAEYVLLGALGHFRRYQDYSSLQRAKSWQPLAIPHISAVHVGIMGCGEIGRFVGEKLAATGFTVHGWSRTPRRIEGVVTYSGEQELATFLGRSHILVCLLPLTALTENILNAELFGQLPKGAYLIQVGRGAHLVEDDLLAALDAGQLAGALLDVFRQEPLPPEHPFWRHAKIRVTPHIASITNPNSAVEQIIANYHRLRQGKEPLNLVDRHRGY
ncbi:glyoxylate/hydroxypyruvate reductase GhrA [Desulfuromonas carbonis]|uniref:2-hydroxyacid dehydrogenase n=1 Tax=Desulfuromonas sp. DDH964 TaxID=1823759 RepID=UPI00078E0622|nr:glyoxylate/hydroxypyruvate reductase A [Desulfuromonas sp. DDH964]AMV71081.1 hydroxypyruvate reductase [Desulfuromonas sp. DDH964]